MNRKLFVLLPLALAAHAAHAGVLASASFESPFTVGDVTGQQGFDTYDTDTTESAMVTSAKSFAGSNSLLISSVADQAEWAYPTISYKGSTAAAGTKVLTTDTRLYLNQSGVGDTYEGLAGLDLYDSSSTAPEGAAVFLGTATGQLYVYGNTTANGVGLYSLTSGGSAITGKTNAWNDLSMTLDFTATGTPVYSIGLNGTIYNMNTSFGITPIVTRTQTITDIDMTAQGGDSAASAYFDNYSVQAVPEPSAFAALGLGAVAMLRRRKRA